MSYSPIVEKAEEALLAYLDSLPDELAGFELRPGRDYETRPVPCLVVNGADSKEREKGARGVFDVELELIVITPIGEGEEADLEAIAHTAACSATIGLINQKATVKSDMNAGGSFQLFDYWLQGSPRRINQGGEWETFISLNLVCASGTETGARTFTYDAVHEGDIALYDTAAVSITVAGLEELQGRFDLSAHAGQDGLLPNAQSISFPSLTTVSSRESLGIRHGSLRIGGSARLKTINAPLLASIARSLVITNLPKLETLLLPALVTLGGNLSITNNPRLTSLELPSLSSLAVGSARTGNVSFYGNALDQACVNALISQLESGTGSLNFVDFRGGTNAAPTGAALAIADGHGWLHN